MDRRKFLRLSTSMTAAGMIQSYAAPLLDSVNAKSKPWDMTAVEFHAARCFVRTAEGRIAYFECGTGPVALFLHGFPLNSFQWRGVIPRLAEDRRCIAPDFLALGYTEVASGQSVTPAAQVDMLVEFLGKLSIGAVDLIANDSGGAVAQLYVARYPKRVRSLLLTNCDTERDSPAAAVKPVIELARAGKFADEWLVPWLADKRLARSEKGLGGLCYMDPSHPTDEAIETYLGPLVESPVREALTNAYAAGLSPNPLAGVEAALKDSKVPTRIVWGAADNIFSQASPDYLNRTFNRSRGVRRVPRAKLFFPEEMPELIAQEAIRLWCH
jgi:pimeloyl-ACP methyl ester carboxylesterase